jgi:non-specific protein-tyrosine kinase
MELLYYLRLIRGNWLLLMLALLVGLTAALVVTVRTPPRYVATITMLVSADDREGSVSTAVQAGVLSQQRVQSYATLLTSRRVLAKIADDGDAEGFQSDVTAEAIPSTSLLRATVADSDPRRAAARADALGDAFTAMIDQIERPTPKSPPTVRVTVVDDAEVPENPVAPRPMVNVALGLLIALLTAVGGLVLRDRLDTSVKTAEALQQVAKTSILGVIGYEREARRNPLITGGSGRSSRSEAFRSLRTNLQFIGVDRQPKSLVVTSCLPNEGKSSVSANLAIAMAQAGWRVILVDGDLRRPSVPGYLGIEGGTGLTDVLIDRARLPEVIQTWGRPGLSVLPSGRVPPNPSELLGSQSMRHVLRMLAEKATVVVDAPPLLPVTDAAVLTAVADGAFVVISAGRSLDHDLEAALNHLKTANGHTLGVIFNRVARRAHDAGYYRSSYYSSDKSAQRAEQRDEEPETVPGRRRAR